MRFRFAICAILFLGAATVVEVDPLLVAPTVHRTGAVQPPIPSPYYSDTVHEELLEGFADGDYRRPERRRVTRSRKIEQPRTVVRRAVIPRNKLEELALRIANKYEINASRFFSTIKCESGWNPNAVGGGGLYLGLMQQHREYWPDRARRAGYEGASAFDPEANLVVSAKMIVNSGWHHWPNCAY